MPPSMAGASKRTKKPPVNRRITWCREMRVVAHLVDKEFNVTNKMLVEVFNTIFADKLTACGVKDGAKLP